MQNRGAIRLLAILLALVSIYQLSFTFITRNIEKDAEEYAQGDMAKQRAYLDSLSGETVYNFLGLKKFSYRDCKEREINLGLDLKGGMNVTLEVSVVDVIKSLSGYSKDSTFVAALKRAKELQKDSQEDFVNLFGQAFTEIDPNARMAAIFATLDLKDKVNFNSTNEEVLKVIRTETENAIDVSFNVLRSRIDKFGVTQPNIQRLETSGRILVELPGVKEPERVRKLLQGTASLEFWETYKLPEVYQFLLDANNKIKEMEEGSSEEEFEKAIQESTGDEDLVAENAIAEPTEEMAEELVDSAAQDSLEGPSLLEQLESDSTAKDSTGMDYEQRLKDFPLFSILIPATTQDGNLVDGAALGYSHKKDTAKVNAYFRLKQVSSLKPRDLMLRWTFKAVDEAENYFQLIALKVTSRDGHAPLSGDVITNARAEFGNNQATAQVSMTMNSDGAKTWARLTKENIKREVAIVLDDYVYSYPTVQGEIKGGNSQITGNFTIAEAQDLANVLKSGKLPAPARIIEEAIVGPSLGHEAINSGLWSFLIAFVLVLLYMIFYYNRAGMVANIALLANIFFIMGVLASLGAVLTLPGIAGIVLTIGMSVDANVLIFERIREELAAGKGLKLAIKDGYNNAYSAIIDANITTLLTAIVLVYFGKGPIQGFATTLIIGILTSLFSAIFITRLTFLQLLNREMTINFATKWTDNAFKNLKIQFITKRKTFYVISSVVLLLSIVSLVSRGLNYGVDFLGGRTYVVRFEQPVNTTDVQNKLKDAYGQAPEVKIFGGSNQIKVTTKHLIDYNTLDDPEIDLNAIYTDLREFIGQDVSFEVFKGMVERTEFDVDDVVEMKLYKGLHTELGDVGFAEFISDQEDKSVGRMSSQKVGPTIADDIKTSAIWAILISLIIIFIYILIRFRYWQFGLGAVAALVHDALIVLGIFSMFYGILPFSLEIDQAFIAAILTVVGYSINDTVVVFDRIREFLNLHPKREREDVYNEALNSTISRTVNTSMTTFVVLFTIFLFGGETIRGFVFALMVGIVVGTYSSLFIATPVAFDTIKKGLKKAVQKK
ncbi:MAG: protein translocase subunit SecDF [Bacteroidales bacterium]|nr:protein translocase subunit SecDF [Bacteroidales bacterium]MCF8455957.1 protein translocase subunit SecDF [Bacteroidales bacterium]